MDARWRVPSAQSIDAMTDYTPFAGRHRDPPVPVLVELLWRMLGPSNKPFICCLYRDSAGLELRCHYEESIDALVRSERVSHSEIAHDIATQWKQAVVDKGFTELKGDA